MVFLDFASESLVRASQRPRQPGQRQGEPWQRQILKNTMVFVNFADETVVRAQVLDSVTESIGSAIYWKNSGFSIILAMQSMVKTISGSRNLPSVHVSLESAKESLDSAKYWKNQRFSLILLMKLWSEFKSASTSTLTASTSAWTAPRRALTAPNIEKNKWFYWFC